MSWKKKMRRSRHANPYWGHATSPPGFTTAILSTSQKTWLRQRSLWIANILAQRLGGPVEDFGNVSLPGVDLLATIVATALIGDDYDYVTHGQTANYNNGMYQAAKSYIIESLPQWVAQAWPPQPKPQLPGG